MPAAVLPSLDKLDPIEAWKPWQPSDKDPWGVKWAGHLYRRAGFGPTRDEVRQAVKAGLPATLDRLLAGNPERAQQDRGAAAEGQRIARRNNPLELRGWWIARILANYHPLREKLTLFWHNHFATSINKVQSVALMLRQNELLRKYALGKFHPFLLEMSKDPAMLIWLDSNSNVKGKPNENYAREIMELFSLGVGNYTEKDIREAARAFTGWHTDGNGFSFRKDLHDFGTKTVLGQTGELDGGDVVRILLEQPAAAKFLVRKLYRWFVSEAQTPPDSFLQPLADAYRKSDYDTAVVIRMMLGSRHFFSEHAYRQRVKMPVEFVLGAVRTLGQNQVSPRALVTQLEVMGQHLFAPPNVKGWECGTAWLNTATVVARHNFAHALCLEGGKLNLADPVGGVGVHVDPSALARRERVSKPEELVAFYSDVLLQGEVPPAERSRLVAFLKDGEMEGPAYQRRVSETIHAIMTVPEYQLA